jgi:hypothetical protein
MVSHPIPSPWEAELIQTVETYGAVVHCDLAAFQQTSRQRCAAWSAGFHRKAMVGQLNDTKRSPPEHAETPDHRVEGPY